MSPTSDQQIHDFNGAIAMEVYEAYDSDPRVNGPYDFDAFRDAIQRIWNRLPTPANPAKEDE